MAFDNETIDVLIGGYMSKSAAHDDYDAGLASGGYLHGAVVVSKGHAGNLAVEQTDHMVREGAAGRGAIGFAVGLFAPLLLAATAVGAAIGAGPANCCTAKPKASWSSRPERPSRSAARA